MSPSSRQSRYLRPRDRPRLGRGARRSRRSSPPQRHALAHAPPPGWTPPSLARRRPLDLHRSTLGDPDSTSIAGRRASGFLQVSLSKVSRHPHQGTRRTSSAETPPMNANDLSRVIGTFECRRSQRSPRRHAALQLLEPVLHEDKPRGRCRLGSRLSRLRHQKSLTIW